MEESFMRNFQFSPDKHGYVGVEREGFLIRNGVISPIAAEIIPAIGHPDIVNEFSACQLEDRIGPCQLFEMRARLEDMDSIIREAESRLGFERRLMELAPEDMPLDCFPAPDGRYIMLRERLSHVQLMAAHRVAGTHIHIGIGSHEQALQAYNRAIPHWRRLCEMGDHSKGARLALYPLVAKHYIPEPYTSWKEVYNHNKR